MVMGLMQRWSVLTGLVCTGAIAVVMKLYESKRCAVCDKSGWVSIYPTIENEGRNDA